MIRVVAAALPGAREGAAASLATAAASLLEYRALLWAHISKENSILVPIADRVLTE